MNNSAFLGIVEQGQLKLLASDHEATGSYRLTTIAMQDGQAPEGGEIELSEQEGLAIIVRGVESDGWIFGATIIEQAGLILTAVAQQVFERGSKEQAFRLKYPWT